MDFIGSKDRLNEWMFTHILRQFNTAQGKLFFDACSGSASVSRYAASKGFEVLACDNLYFPRHLTEGSIGKVDKETSWDCIEEMNCVDLVEGYFFKNFSESAGRLYFTDDNARRIDACRQYLNGVEDAKLYSYLIYCLLEAVSRVSNTAGTYGAFLKKFKARARARIDVRPEPMMSGNCEAYQSDLLGFLDSPTYRKKHIDVVYIDPPYNERQYAPNYHLYEALVRYDDEPVKGKTGQRDWVAFKSKFCSRKTFFPFLSQIMEKLRAPLMYFSYSTEGLVTQKEIEQWMAARWDYTLFHRSQKRYKADNNREYDDEMPLVEFLFEVRVN